MFEQATRQQALGRILLAVLKSRRVMLVTDAVESETRQILDRMPEPRLLIQANCRIVHANPEAFRVLRYGRGGLVGMDVRRLVPPAEAEALTGYWKAFLAGPGAGASIGPATLQVRRRDGSAIPCEVTLVKLDLAAGQHVLVMLRDETYHRKAALELAMRQVQARSSRELARLKDHFLSLISHEIKTPLSIIIGNAELLQDRHPEEPFLDDINRAALEVSRRIDSILDYSALISGSLPLFRSEVLVDEIVTTAVELAQDRFCAKGIRFEAALELPAPVVVGDSRRLLQIVAALLENAVKYSREGDRAGIRAGRDGGMARLEVWDTGPGMSHAQKERALAPFGRSLGRVTDPLGGLGLGLPIARLLAELHGGQVRIDTVLGKGTTVAVTLPCSN